MQATAQKKTKDGAQRQVQVSTRRPWWRHALELSLVVPLSLVLLEGLLHLAGVGQEEFLEPDKTIGVRHIAGKKVVWRLEGLSEETLSSAGLRDVEHTIAKPAGTIRIALLGDSATEGLQVPLPDTYGMQLSKLLVGGKQPIEVINFGCSSYSNGQELLQLRQEVAKYKPDLVVLMYNRGDFVENIRDPRTLKAEPRPYFYLVNGRLTQDNEVMQANAKTFAPQPVLQFLRNNSCIYGILSHLNLTLTLNEPAYSKLRNSIMKKLDRETKAKYAAYRQTYPIQDVWGVTQSIFAEIETECRAQGSRFAVVCFPNIVQDKDYANQIEELRKMASRDRFGYVDLTPDYIGASDPKKLFLKYHFSSAGHELAARKIAPLVDEWLKE